jgi:hypothetical protein
MFIYEKLLNAIFWIIKTVSPSVGPQITSENKWRKNNEKITPVPSGYGFDLDYWDTNINILSTALSFIHVFDIIPTLNPEFTECHLSNKHASRIPIESSNIENLTDFLVNNTGSYFLKHVIDDIYMVDFSDFEQYEVRVGLERYGGKVFIENNKIIGYEYQGQKYAADNKRMDLIIRATLCLKMMVEMHAIKIHLCNAQRKTLEYYNKYNEDSPLADFLSISSFSVLDVTRRIPILISPDGGLVVRLFGLTVDSYRQIFQNITAQPAFTREDILGEKGTVWHKELSKYSMMVDKLLASFTDDKEEALDLANFFITSTAVHNQFGDSQIYAMTISKMWMPKVYINSPGLISTLDQELLTVLLYAVTARYPLIIDKSTNLIFSNLKQRQAWTDFQDQIKEEYTSKNWFPPHTFEISCGF